MIFPKAGIPVKKCVDICRYMSIYAKALYVLNIFEVDDVQGKRMKRQLTSVQCFSFNMLNRYSALTESLHG